MSGRVIIIGAFFMALAGAALGIMLFNPGSGTEATVQIITVEVRVTNTPDPNATIPVIIVTATPDRDQVTVPTSLAQAVSGVTVIAPTIDSTQLAANPALSETQLAVPQNCVLYTVAAGDTPFGIAQEFDANPFDLLAANGLTEENSTGLQIGDVLIVPLEGCPLHQLPNYQPQSQIVTVPTANPIATGSVTAISGTPAAGATTSGSTTSVAGATLTLAPTAVNAQLTIARVENAGDVTAEGIVILNSGNTVNMTGWTLTNSKGQTYTFTQYILFSKAFVTVYTRIGQNTPAALYWGRDTAVWSDAGDVATLTDAQGKVQATVRLSTLIELDS